MGTPIPSNDRRLRQAAVRSGVFDDDKKVELEGPDYRQVKHAQKDAVLLGGLKHLGKEGVTKAAEEGAKQLAEFAMKEGAVKAGTALGAFALAAPALTTAATLTELWTKAAEEGAEQNRAMKRDAVALAVVDVGVNALPAGYVQHMQHELIVSKEDAGKVMENLLHKHGPEAWKSIKTSTERLIRQGEAQAKKLGIHDDKSLRAKLSDKKSNFAAAYHSSLALRIGVQSPIWIAQHPSR